jgi:hypothetical protein
MRLNHFEEEEIGRAPDLAGESTMSKSQLGGTSQLTNGCPRFGYHSADAHRVSEILGGAFADDTSSTLG